MPLIEVGEGVQVHLQDGLARDVLAAHAPGVPLRRLDQQLQDLFGDPLSGRDGGQVAMELVVQLRRPLTVPRARRQPRPIAPRGAQVAGHPHADLGPAGLAVPAGVGHEASGVALAVGVVGRDERGRPLPEPRLRDQDLDLAEAAARP